jgi:hypothetical protein
MPTFVTTHVASNPVVSFNILDQVDNIEGFKVLICTIVS